MNTEDLNPPRVGRPMSRSESSPGLPVAFIVVTFVAAAIVGAVVLYLGLNGTLGAAIP